MDVKKLNKLTVAELKNMIEQRGIELPQGKKLLKKDYIEILLENTAKDIVEDAVQKGIEIGRAQGMAEVFRDIYPMRVLSMLKAIRILVAVRFDDPEFIGNQCYEPCKNFAFEFSTGTSNAFNFKGVFLPIIRQDANGWLNKAYNMNEGFLVKLFMKKQYAKVDLSDESRTEMNNTFEQFLPRFGCWRQLQISAALSTSSSLWQKTRFFRDLRQFALTYNCYSDKTMSVLNKEKDEIINQARVIGINSAFPFDDIPKAWSNMKGIVRIKALILVENITKMSVHPRLAEIERYYAKEDTIKNDDIFFYRRDLPIQPIPFEVEQEPDRSVTYKMVNEWLLENDALCSYKDLK